MNPITYELQDARLLANKGTVSPVEPALSSKCPCIIFSTDPVIVTIGDNEHELAKNQCMLLKSADGMQLRPAGTGPFAQVYAIVFQSYRLDEKTDSSLLYRLSYEHLPEHGRMLGLSRQALQQVEALIAGYSFSMETTPRLDLMLNDLLNTLLDGNKYGTGFQIQDRAVQQILAYMNSHFSRPLTRSEMARLSGFNQSYFSYLFRKETGWSFTEYLNRIRIDEAKRLLLATEDTLQEIAGKTGFTDGSYLSKIFKKITGISTSEFRMLQGAERIAAMQFLGALLALGIRPVATTREMLQTSVLLSGDLAGTAEMEEIYSVEVLKQQKPELILAPTYYYRYPQSLKLLEEIAPVIMLEWGALPKPDEVRLIGSLLGRGVQADEWILHLEEKAAAARQRISHIIAAGETAGLYEHRYDNTWLMPHYTARSVFGLYRLLGLAPPARIKQEVLDPGIHLRVGEQALPAYAADHMFVIVPSSDTAGYLAELMTQSVWQKLVHEQGARLYLLPLSEFWMDDGVSLERQVDKLAALLAGDDQNQQFYRAEFQPAYMDDGPNSPL